MSWRRVQMAVAAGVIAFVFGCAEPQAQKTNSESWPALDGCNDCSAHGETWELTTAVCLPRTFVGERCYEEFIFDTDPDTEGLQFECGAATSETPASPIVECEASAFDPVLPDGVEHCWHARETRSLDGCEPGLENLFVGVLHAGPEPMPVAVYCHGLDPTLEMLCSAGPPSAADSTTGAD